MLELEVDIVRVASRQPTEALFLHVDANGHHGGRPDDIQLGQLHRNEQLRGQRIPLQAAVQKVVAASCSSYHNYCKLSQLVDVVLYDPEHYSYSQELLALASMYTVLGTRSLTQPRSPAPTARTTSLRCSRIEARICWTKVWRSTLSFAASWSTTPS